LPHGATTRLGTVRFRHGDFVYDVAFLPNGQAVASASADGSVRLWEVATRKELRRFVGGGLRLDSIAISPDGRALARGSQDRSGRVWETATGGLLHRWETRGPLYAIRFSPDGKNLAACSTSVRVWEVETGAPGWGESAERGWLYDLAYVGDA